MKTTWLRILLLSSVALLFICPVGLAGEPIPFTSPEATNRAALASIVKDLPILINGEFKLVNFVDTLATAAGFKFSLAERFREAPVKVERYETTTTEALVWIGNECGFVYSEGSEGELVIRSTKRSAQSPCVNGGAGLSHIS